VLNVRRFKAFVYFLILWSTVLSEKLTGPQLVREFPAFY
jgi:hypothetical protein